MAEIGGALERAWARTDRLFEIVRGEMYTRGIPLRHPFVFYLGHLPAFAWNQLSTVLGRPPIDARLDRLFARGIDPDDVSTAEASAPEAWPEIPAVEAYRDRVREAVRGLLPELPGADDPMARWVGPLVLEHELMHHETLLYMVARVDPERLRRPDGWRDPVEGRGRSWNRVTIPAGSVAIGGDRERQPFGWCTEFPRRRVEVDAFEIDDLPVAVGRYLRFVESGGYDDPSWWTDEDWTWRAAAGIGHPDAWRRSEQGWQVRSLLRWHDLNDVSGWPVYVSLAEARAFCRWAGVRLPTEPELHRAAYADPGGDDRSYPWGEEDPRGRGAFDFEVHGPVPVGTYPAGASAWGVHELVGNGWEWTETPFVRWEGFEAHLPTYPGYSADFFDGRHFVVFGASWCTDRRLLRRSFRNWYQQHYPYVFATFRTVSDGGIRSPGGPA